MNNGSISFDFRTSCFYVLCRLCPHSYPKVTRKLPGETLNPSEAYRRSIPVLSIFQPVIAQLKEATEASFFQWLFFSVLHKETSFCTNTGVPFFPPINV